MNNTNSNSTFIKSYDNKYYINVNHKKKVNIYILLVHNKLKRKKFAWHVIFKKDNGL